MAYPTAVGCGCLLGAGGALDLHAAEWSLQPLLSVAADYDSDRSLLPHVSGSEQAVLSADLKLMRSMETWQWLLEPQFDLRRFSSSVWGPGDDRSVLSSISWTGERSQASLSASAVDQNTLSTEVLQTGLVNTNTRRRLDTASLSLDHSLSERNGLFTQVTYLKSSYSGPRDIELLLPGFRYTSGTLGARFVPSEHWTVSPSAFGDLLHSDRAGGSSHEAGGQLQIGYTQSERYNFNLQVGESQRVLGEAVGYDSGGHLVYRQSSNLGTNIAFTAVRNFELSALSVNYTRSLVPYGNGFLVERQMATVTFSHSLSAYLDTDLAATRIDNNYSTVRLRLDRRYYENLTAGLNWKLSETWKLRPEVSTSWAPPIGSTQVVREWRVLLALSWKPIATVISR